MLKQLLLAILLMVFSATVSSASVLIRVGDDVGDNQMRIAIHHEMLKVQNQTGQEFKQRVNELRDFQENFGKLATEKEIIEFFGPKIERRSKNFALPVYESGWVGYSGLHSLHSPNRSHDDFYNIGNFAAARVFFGFGGEDVVAMVFYFKVDESFPKLTNWKDLAHRLKWENARLKQLQNWVAERRESKTSPTSTQQGAAPDRLQLRSFRSQAPFTLFASGGG